MDEQKYGLYIEWDKTIPEAISCLVLIANDLPWRRWLQHEHDTRGIVTERAAKAITKHMNALQRAVNDCEEGQAR